MGKKHTHTYYHENAFDLWMNGLWRCFKNMKCDKGAINLINGINIRGLIT